MSKVKSSIDLYDVDAAQTVFKLSKNKHKDLLFAHQRALVYRIYDPPANVTVYLDSAHVIVEFLEDSSDDQTTPKGTRTRD